MSDTPIEPNRIDKPVDQDAGLERELGGDLPCVVCGYSLRGMSIRGVCPECGTRVRATILAMVDPLAAELRPIRRPRLVASSLVLWVGAALAAALVSWIPAILVALGELPGRVTERPHVEWWVLGLAIASGVGAAGLLRPHAGVPRASTALVALSLIGYAILVFLLWQIEAGFDAVRGEPRYLSPGGAWVTMGRTPLHAASFTLMALIAMGMRPMARLLVARSLVLRTGRVDRQRVLAIAAAAAMVGVGDSIGIGARLVGGPAMPTLAMVGVILLAIGAVLVTIGLFGATADAFRIARAIVAPHPGLREVLGERRAAPRTGTRA